jgi:hypothetical protein
MCSSKDELADWRKTYRRDVNVAIVGKEDDEKCGGWGKNLPFFQI